jgi:hypothetical protein
MDRANRIGPPQLRQSGAGRSAFKSSRRLGGGTNIPNAAYWVILLRRLGIEIPRTLAA